VLDGITDPRNLGAIIRTAEVFGAAAVVIGKDRSAGLNSAAVKVSAGAAEILPVVTVVNIVQSLKLLKEKGFWVVGTAVDGEKNCFQYDWAGPTVVVLGSEERGLRRLVRESCDAVVKIPFKGKITSLNVASAAAVIMYEILRQKEKKDVK
jgi:23S rRNA (guanosine2251-2'-O)-methyltransferase